MEQSESAEAAESCASEFPQTNHTTSTPVSLLHTIFLSSKLVQTKLTQNKGLMQGRCKTRLADKKMNKYYYNVHHIAEPGHWSVYL